MFSGKLDVNEVYFDEEQHIPNTRERWCRCGKCGVMDTDAECLSCAEVEALGYLQLSEMRYDDSNEVTERVTQQSCNFT